MEKSTIRFLLHDQIHMEKWDDCIENSFNGLAYAESWYLDIVSPDWCALVQDDYVRVMPLPVKKKHGIPYIVQPLFVQQLGVFSVKELNAEVITAFLNAIPRRYLYVNYNLNSQNNYMNTSIKHLNHELDLIDDYTSIVKNYSTNIKRNIRKAVKAKLSIVKHVRPEEIIDLFRIDRGNSITAWGDKEYALLLRLLYSGIHKNRFDTYGVLSAQNTLIAGAVFLKSHKALVFLFSGNSPEGKECGAMPFLIDKFIEDHAEMQVTLDFEGSNDHNLARFYKSFGASPIFYPIHKTVALPKFMKPLFYSNFGS